LHSLGPRARAATQAQVAAAGDIVLVTIALGKIDQVAAEPSVGKVVIDTCNYYPSVMARSPRSMTSRPRPMCWSSSTC